MFGRRSRKSTDGDRLVKDPSGRLATGMEPAGQPGVLGAAVPSRVGPGTPASVAAAEANDYGADLYEEYRRTGNLQTLQRAITAFREAVDATPVGHPGRDLMLSNLGKTLLWRFRHTGQLADLDQAITACREAADATPATHPGRPVVLSNLGAILRSRFARTGQAADLDQAISLAREAADATPADYPERFAVLTNLGAALSVRFGRTGQLADLDQAITASREAIDATPASNPGRPLMLSNLGNALRIRFERTGQEADLDQAITVGREAVDGAPVGHPDRVIYLNNAGIALRMRFRRAGQQADLDQAITLLREAVDATPGDHPDRASRLSNLGGMLQARFGRAGRQADLDQAITLVREALDATPAGSPDRPLYLSNLGNALGRRFERTGQQADLDKAVTLFREALNATPAESPDRPGRLSDLGDALHSRFGRTGQQADLDDAITVDREAVNTTPADHTKRPGHLSSLGNALAERFERTGQQADLDQAVTLFREAVEATPAGSPDRPGNLDSLGMALQGRYERLGRQEDLDQAITIGREAVEATPARSPDRHGYLSSLGRALLGRFERLGRQEDLERAITWLGKAVEATPAGHPDRPARLSNLGIALHARFVHLGRQADLDQAIALFRRADAVAQADHPDRPRMLASFGRALAERFERTGRQADLDQAIEVYRAGAGGVTASPSRRIEAARGWGRCALLAGAGEDAADGYTAAIELLPLVAWHGLDQPTREHHLREWAGLASDGAAAAIAAGHPARAVELLEAGRSMLWTQALHLRHDLAALQERAPGLAAALEAARAVLNAAPGRLDTASDVDRAQAAEQRILEERRRAARDWDTAVDRIRQIEGFEHFLRPVPFADLRAAASGGPVVIVNISQHGSHALIVTPATASDPGPPVLAVDLPDASMSAVIDQANALLGARYRASDPAADWQAREDDRHAVFNVLAWCWRAITEPVLTVLGHTRTFSGRIEDWPRVWWCPTGPATALPLHAAGRHPRTTTQYAAMGEAAARADSVAGRVISSYTPTLTTLARARTRAAPGRARQLAVGVSEAPGVSSLPAVPDELRAVTRYLPIPDQASHLVGPAATKQAVLSALPGHSWLHLSCHGVQHPADASLSAFLLHDQPLTLADLAALNLRETDLAYLAACQTATGDVRLPDEALHLAGALQLVGYRHVLATLWSISDAAAPFMADITYAHLLHPDPDRPAPADRVQAARAPFALHHAVTGLRQACPGEPLLWAPYIHLGP